MDRKRLVLLLVLLSISFVAFAGGKKDVTERSVGPEESWSETFDVTRRSGKYNVYASAKDLAGNEGLAGPFNIWLDEESDLPVINVTNPTHGMRVPGNLNIVGTCFDDDKVEAVYLILDGDKENPVLANGTDFWSYYLDTNGLAEGTHTIEAYGVDNGNPNAYYNEEGEIDESRVKPKTGHSMFVTWQLDRHAPVTKITNLNMGSLVSGKITLEGTTSDGNGISTLEYSIDGGVHYTPLKLKQQKLSEPDEFGATSFWSFSLPIDTKNMSDGPTLVWFKAIDSTGSIGITSFLCFIDNAAPEVKIVTPAPDETVNGLFTIAGYAKDTIGLKSLSYQWGSKSGELPLTAGNPYWAVELDSREVTSSRDFIITAVDSKDNKVSFSRTFMNSDRQGKKGPSGVVWVNQNGDKPTVEIKYPVGEVNGEDGSLFLRGLGSDDDGLSAVYYSLDGGPEQRIETTGVFYAPIPGTLSNGNHKIKVYGVDKFGVKGDPVEAEFSSKGVAPQFADEKYKDAPFANGMPINPEEGGEYSVNVTSSTGLKSVHYDWTWGSSGGISNDVSLEPGATSVPVRIGFGADETPWGVSKLTITATDKFDRVSTHGVVFNVTDLTRIHGENGVYFDDSTVAADGAINTDSSNSVTGYFVGGKISSVRIQPSIRSVSVTTDGNTIKVTSAASTSPFTVNVTSSSGAVYTSRRIFFPSKESAPVLSINDNSIVTGVFNNFNVKNNLTISGTVTSQSTPTVKYRILAAEVTYDENGTVKSSKALPVTPLASATPVNVRRGAFSINLTADNFVDGMSILEIIASNASGKMASTAVLVRKIGNPVSADLTGGVSVEPAAPATYWLHGDEEGMDYYAVCVYQGDAASIFSFKDYDSLPAGESIIEFNGVKQKVSKAAGVIEGRFSSVDGMDYRSGMDVLLVRDGTPETDPHVLTAKINSTTPVTSVEWTAQGRKLPAGEIRSLGGGVYEADVSISGLAAGIVAITAKVNNSTDVVGHINVIRGHGNVDNAEAIYWTTAGGAVYDAANRRYILDNGAELVGFANIGGTLSATLSRATQGLEVSVDGQLVKLKAVGDGSFNNVSVRVVNNANGSYISPSVNLIADTSAPVITVTTIKPMDYVNDKLVLNGTVTDGNGVASLEYKMSESDTVTDAEGNTVSAWKPVSVASSGRFNATVKLDDVEDGYMPITLRATDRTGKVSYFNSALKKDSTPPEIQIVVPEPGAKINGETLFVFNVKDDSYVGTIQYVSPNGKIKKDFELKAIDSLPPQKEEAPVEAEAPAEGEEPQTAKASEEPSATVMMSDFYSNVLTGAMPSTRLGQEGLPIDDTMKFIAKDTAGNTTVVDTFQFEIDPESDLPVVEIHMPQENEVITTDFVISGVMYDDDGMQSSDGKTICKVYYKVDDSDYQLIPNPNGFSSFEIGVKPLSLLTDNEHVLSMYAEDINGVKGKVVKRMFRVSLSEPEGSVEAPKLSETVKGSTVLSGWASDKNGISKVQISVDNGASYNDAVVVPGKNRGDPARWTYEFDSRVIQDGTHAVFLKIWDGYDIYGLYTSLINIDNTPPELHLELPVDDSTIASNLFVSGQTTDNIELTSLYMRIRSLDGKKVPDYLAENDLYPDSIISQSLDISELDNGLYNIEITGMDNAGNRTNVSRNVHLLKDAELTKVNLLYPLNGEHVQGEFNIYGTAESLDEKIESIEILVDGQRLPGYATTLTESGYFSFRMKNQVQLDKKAFTEQDAARGASDAEARNAENEALKAVVSERNEKRKAEIQAAKDAAKEAGVKYEGPEYEAEVPELKAESMYESGVFELSAGTHVYQVIAHTDTGRTIESNKQTVIYDPYGPWVTLDNFTYGDFAIERPLLKGDAGYVLTPEEAAKLKDKKLPTEEKTALKAKKVKRVYLSLDNGRTYKEVSRNGKGAWKYRIEDQDIAEGFHFLLVKAEMENGESAITRTIVQVDRTKPTVRLISPGVGGHYNQQLKFEGLSSDDVELEDVTLYLRKGDLSSYGVPKFIQGLYFDVSFWGATLWSAGVGLTAFDDAVKIQVQYGQFLQGQRDIVSKILGQDPAPYRYGQHVIGLKILAQVADIPFNHFFGHDYDWLSATVALGANFSWFSDSGAGISQFLSAILAQVEFPHMTFKKNKYFKTWAVYWEPQLWLLPSDVVTNKSFPVVFQFAIGLRASVF
ncbi:MAG TPA: hypothetical protein DCZ74_08535 [Treponema sp.]|nr:hypothetical protein [Treponema sp.]